MARGMAFDASRNRTRRAAFSGFRSHRMPRQPNRSPLPGPADLVRDSDGPLRAGEELELAGPTRCRTKRQHLKGKPIVSIAGQYGKARHEALAHPVEPPLLALQAGEDLPLPALLDALDPDRRDVDRHPILEPRAEKRVHVWVRRPACAAVVMDRENPLGSSQGTTECLVDRITHDALGLGPVQPPEAFRRGVVHGHDEAEVGRVPETSSVLAEGPTDRRLVASEGSVSLPDPVELAPASVGQSFLTVGDVPDLPGGAIRASVVSRLNEEHLSSSPSAASSPFRPGPAPRLRRPAPTHRLPSRAAPPGARLR